jgi:hypothetical protein
VLRRVLLFLFRRAQCNLPSKEFRESRPVKLTLKLILFYLHWRVAV